MILIKYTYDKNFNKTEICKWSPGNKFKEYFHKIYSEFEKEKCRIDSFFETPWHIYDKYEYYN